MCALGRKTAHIVCCFCQKRLKRSGALNSEHLCVNLRRPQTDALRSCDSWSAGTTKSGERVLVSGDWSGVERTPPQCAALCARRALSCSVVRAARARAGRPQGRGPRGAGEARASRGRRGLDSLEFLDFDFLPPCALCGVWSTSCINYVVVLSLNSLRPNLTSYFRHLIFLSPGSVVHVRLALRAVSCQLKLSVLARRA